MNSNPDFTEIGPRDDIRDTWRFRGDHKRSTLSQSCFEQRHLSGLAFRAGTIVLLRTRVTRAEAHFSSRRSRRSTLLRLISHGSGGRTFPDRRVLPTRDLRDPVRRPLFLRLGRQDFSAPSLAFTRTRLFEIPSLIVDPLTGPCTIHLASPEILVAPRKWRLTLRLNELGIR